MERAIGLHRDVHQALGAVALDEIGQLVELPARVVPAARRADRVDGAAAGERIGEDAKVHAAEGFAQVDQLHAEAQIGLVRSISAHRLFVGKAREWGLLNRPIREHLPADAGHHLLDDGHHVFGSHEAHLDVDLGVLQLAVAARVLVAIGARQLVVAVVAGDHQQLLELLR